MSRPGKGHYLSDEPNRAGYYEIRWSEGGRSQRRSTCTGDRAQANQVFARFLLALTEDQAREGGLPTIGELLDIYVRDQLPKMAGNPKTVINGVEHLKAELGGIIVTELTPTAVEHYVQKRAQGRVTWTCRQTGKTRGGRPSGGASVRVELGRLVAAVNYAVKIKLLDSRHAPYVPLPPAGNPKDRWLTKVEATALLRAAQPDPAARLTRVYRFAAVALYTAARRESIETLPWSRIHLDGDKSYIDFQDPRRRRTSKKRGVVPVGPELLPVLERSFRERTGPWFLDRPTDMLMPFIYLVAPDKIRAAKRRAPLKTAAHCDRREGVYYVDEAGETQRLVDVTPHTLRHTWATWAAQDGVSLFEIAGVLHDTVQTVEKHYAHHCPNHLRAATGRSLLGGALMAAE